MVKRRANNEGTVYQKKDGKWRAQITLGSRRLSKTGKTQKECQEWLRKTRHQVDQGFTFKGSNIKLKDFLIDWLVTVRSSRALGTLRLYQYDVDKKIIPFLGHKYLTELSSENVQRTYDSMLANGYSESAVISIHKTLRVSLNHAMKLGLIARNPCTNTSPPKLKQKEMKFFDEEQAKIFLETAQRIEDRFYTLYYLAIHTGLRQAELLGLKWSDLDDERCTLNINRQAQHFKGGGFKFTAPKTKSGRRTITLGQVAIQKLLAHKMVVKKMVLKAGNSWEEHNLIFPSTIGTPVTASNLRREYRKVQDACDLPKIRFHDLRHTAASLMLNNGIPVIVASQRLGHSKASITMDVYGHLMPIKQEEAAYLMDSLLQ